MNNMINNFFYRDSNLLCRMIKSSIIESVGRTGISSIF